MPESEGPRKFELDEVMLAMDVVDTLRHQRSLVEQELQSEDRERELIEKLKKTYTDQGLAVSDEVIAQGVRAMREERFAYQPPPKGLKTSLARMHVHRGRWIKGVAQHGHIVSIHNGPREPAFAQRFAADPEAIDAVLFQDWGTRDEQNGWLAAGIEEVMGRALQRWPGSAVLAEYGYERNPEFPLHIPGHAFCGPDHTRRATWRGLCSGVGVIHGFENSWGPWQKLDEDQPGMTYLGHALNFFREITHFAELRPVCRGKVQRFKLRLGHSGLGP